MSPTTTTTQKRWLPQWVLRLLGYSSLAAALISVAIFLYKRFPPSSRPPRRAVGSGERQVKQRGGDGDGGGGSHDNDRDY